MPELPRHCHFLLLGFVALVGGSGFERDDHRSDLCLAGFGQLETEDERIIGRLHELWPLALGWRLLVVFLPQCVQVASALVSVSLFLGPRVVVGGQFGEIVSLLAQIIHELECLLQHRHADDILVHLDKHGQHRRPVVYFRSLEFFEVRFQLQDAGGR